MPPKVTVVRPNITDEERQKRIKTLENTMSRLLNCKVTLREKDEDEEEAETKNT